VIPALRQTSPAAVPSSACRKMKATCGSENIDRFMVLRRPTARITLAANLEFPTIIGPEKSEAGHV
jgi:hypothetical protein